MKSLAHRTCLALLNVLALASVCVAQSNPDSPAPGKVSIRFKAVDAPPPAEPVPTTQAPAVMATSHEPPSTAKQPTPSTAGDAAAILRTQFIDLAKPSARSLMTMERHPLEDFQGELLNEDRDDDLGGMFSSSSTSHRSEDAPRLRQARQDRSPLGNTFGQRESSLPTDGRSEAETREHAVGISPQSNVSADDLMRTVSADRAAGLRDDAYYQSLGAPQISRPRNTSHAPMTLGQIFGDEDQYDPSCVQRYCNMVWDCAGGRRQTWFGRMVRDIDRRILLNNSQRCGYQMFRNDFKCPKLGANDASRCGAFGSRCQPQAAPGSGNWPPELQHEFEGTEWDGIYYEIEPDLEPLPQMDSARRTQRKHSSISRDRNASKLDSDYEVFEDVTAIARMQPATTVKSKKR